MSSHQLAQHRKMHLHQGADTAFWDGGILPCADITKQSSVELWGHLDPFPPV